MMRLSTNQANHRQTMEWLGTDHKMIRNRPNHKMIRNQPTNKMMGQNGTVSAVAWKLPLPPARAATRDHAPLDEHRTARRRRRSGAAATSRPSLAAMSVAPGAGAVQTRARPSALRAKGCMNDTPSCTSRSSERAAPENPCLPLDTLSRARSWTCRRERRTRGGDGRKRRHARRRGCAW